MGEREYIDLLELQTRIKEGIQDAFPGRYWVKAEISSWSPRANGHCYLTLTQSRAGKPVAESRAMIWKWHYTQIIRYFEEATGQKLQAGITVLVKVQVNFSELYGISLYIEDIDAAFTLGEQALERKRAIERLTKDGYMDMQKELAIPDIPQRLAVITSKTAAGYQDFRNHLLNNPDGFAFSLDLYEATMQGEQAPDSIADALTKAQEKDYDAILIGHTQFEKIPLSHERQAAMIQAQIDEITTAIAEEKAEQGGRYTILTERAEQNAPTDRNAPFPQGFVQAYNDRTLVEFYIGVLETAPLETQINLYLHDRAAIAALDDRINGCGQQRTSVREKKWAMQRAGLKTDDLYSVLQDIRQNAGKLGRNIPRYTNLMLMMYVDHSLQAELRHPRNNRTYTKPDITHMLQELGIRPVCWDSYYETAGIRN